MPEYYPPVGFHFRVEFGLFGIGEGGVDSRFQEVSGLSSELGVESYDEGGENRFSHRFPNRAKHGNLVLKRGLLTNSALSEWCLNAIENFEITPTEVIVALLNEQHDPLAAWQFTNAWPTKWSSDPFTAQDGKLVVESMELSYNYFRRIS